jgi:hypothetical protein
MAADVPVDATDDCIALAGVAGLRSFESDLDGLQGLEYLLLA